MAENLYEIGGRKWRAITRTTIEHDVEIMRLVTAAGLDKVQPEPDEAEADYAVRLLKAILFSGYAFELVGSMVVPNELKDQDWTIDMKRETALFMAAVEDPQDKAVLQGLMVGVFTGFFESALASFASSRGASNRPAASAEELSE